MEHQDKKRIVVDDGGVADSNAPQGEMSDAASADTPAENKQSADSPSPKKPTRKRKIQRSESMPLTERQEGSLAQNETGKHIFSQNVPNDEETQAFIREELRKIRREIFYNRLLMIVFLVVVVAFLKSGLSDINDTLSMTLQFIMAAISGGETP